MPTLYKFPTYYAVQETNFFRDWGYIPEIRGAVYACNAPDLPMIFTHFFDNF
jgi:hypothetical protein